MQNETGPLHSLLHPCPIRRRIAKLLSVPTVQADPSLANTLVDFPGAVYALVFAERGDFTDRATHSIDITSVRKHAEQMAAGGLRPEGK
jgi:hypothetical protein